jgi:hypothetical protein
MQRRGVTKLGSALLASLSCHCGARAGLVGVRMLKTVCVCPWAGGGGARARKEILEVGRAAYTAACRRRAVEIPGEPLFGPAFPRLSPTPRSPYPNADPARWWRSPDQRRRPGPHQDRQRWQ